MNSLLLALLLLAMPDSAGTTTMPVSVASLQNRQQILKEYMRLEIERLSDLQNNVENMRVQIKILSVTFLGLLLGYYLSGKEPARKAIPYLTTVTMMTMYGLDTFQYDQTMRLGENMKIDVKTLNSVDTMSVAVLKYHEENDRWPAPHFWKKLELLVCPPRWFELTWYIFFPAVAMGLVLVRQQPKLDRRDRYSSTEKKR
jgi:hypothetical protein